MEDYSIHSDFVKDIDTEILRLIQKGMGEFDDNIFNRLALKEFEVQYNNISYLKNLCQDKGVIPEAIDHWEQIPAVDSAIFKKDAITTFPLYETELALTTSGTSDP